MQTCIRVGPLLLCSRIKFRILIRLLPSVMSSVCLCSSDSRLKDVKRPTAEGENHIYRQKGVSFSLCGRGVWGDTLHMSFKHGPVSDGLPVLLSPSSSIPFIQHWLARDLASSHSCSADSSTSDLSMLVRTEVSESLLSGGWCSPEGWEVQLVTPGKKKKSVNPYQRSASLWSM